MVTALMPGSARETAAPTLTVRPRPAAPAMTGPALTRSVAETRIVLTGPAGLTVSASRESAVRRGPVRELTWSATWRRTASRRSASTATWRLSSASLAVRRTTTAPPPPPPAPTTTASSSDLTGSSTSPSPLRPARTVRAAATPSAT